jgi:hypothetical protein
MNCSDDIWDDLFMGCALTAYLEVWGRSGRFPPDSEATRRLAYRYYEDALAEKNGRPPRQGSLAA